MSVPFLLSQVAMWILVVLQGFVLLGVVRVVHQRGTDSVTSLAPAHGERLSGQLAPRIETVDIHGNAISSDDFVGALRAVLFVSPNCGNCMVSLDELEGLKVKAPGTVVAVCLAGTEECRLMAEDLKLTVPVIADPDEYLKIGFDVTTTPTAVLVNRRGRIVQYGHPGRDGVDLEEIVTEQVRAEPVEAAEHER